MNAWSEFEKVPVALTSEERLVFAEGLFVPACTISQILYLCDVTTVETY